MQVIDFTEPVKENPYTNDIKALADLPEGKAGEFVFPAAEKVKHTRQISKAANGIDKTARIRVSEDVTDDNGEAVTDENGEKLHRVVVTLTKRHVARRGEKTATTDEVATAVADAPADAEVVAEAPAEATDEAHEAPTPRKRR